MTAILAVTPDAATQMKTMLTDGGQGATAIRVGVKARGCSGMMYYMEYATNAEDGDEVVEQDGVTLYVDPASVMHLLGTTINYVSSDTEEGFTFDNPNVALVMRLRREFRYGSVWCGRTQPLNGLVFSSKARHEARFLLCSKMFHVKHLAFCHIRSNTYRNVFLINYASANIRNGSTPLLCDAACSACFQAFDKGWP